MWQRFTERARKVVFYAQEEASQLGENDVGPEHLLLGLVRENDSVAARILLAMDVDLGRIRAKVESEVPHGDGRSGRDMELTPRAKRVIDLAYEEARFLNNNYIGTEHLLLGLIREGKGLSGKVLADLGAELFRTRDVVMRLQEGRLVDASSGQREARPTWFSWLARKKTTAKDMQLTPRAKRALDLAYVEARQSNNNYVDTEHLLLALIREGEGLAGRVLTKLGVDLDQARQAVKKLQEGNTSDGGS